MTWSVQSKTHFSNTVRPGMRRHEPVASPRFDCLNRPMARRAAPKKREDAAKIRLRAAKIADLLERASFLEAALERGIDKPATVARDLVAAVMDSSLPGDASAARLVGFARRMPAEPKVLEIIGRELDERYCEDEAVEVLRLAVASGAQSKQVLEVLGRLLVQRGDADGVPLLERAIERAPDWEPPRIALAVWFVDKNPQRALAVLADHESDQSHELRAMIYAATGRKRLAAREQLAALSVYTNDLEARTELCRWHYNEHRYARALEHARTLFEMRTDMSPRELARIDVDELEELILGAYRIGGAFAELVPFLRERCADGVPPELAYDVFYGLTAQQPIAEPELAIRAAETLAHQARHDGNHDEALVWTVRIAGVRAMLGDIGALEAIARDGLGDNAAGWNTLGEQYLGVEAYDAAHAAIDRALELDPDSTEALAALFHCALASGDAGGLHRSAEAIAAVEPLSHRGPEHLGRSFARRGDAEAAVTHARRAAAVGPYCAIAWTAVAEAAIIARDDAAARAALARSLALEAMEPGDDISIVHAALHGTPATLEQALAARYKHLPALPFPAYVEALRDAARRHP